MSSSEQIEKKIRASFAKQSLMATFGAEVLSVADGKVTLMAPITDQVLQQHSAAHAGLAFALGDSAAGYSAVSQVAEHEDVMTSEMKINLLRPAIGDRLIAEGQVVKPGRRLIIVQADVFAEKAGERSHIAILLGTMVPIKP